MAITLRTPPYNPGVTQLTVTHTNEAGAVIGPFAVVESGGTGVYTHTRTIAQMPAGYYLSQLLGSSGYLASYATRVVADGVDVVLAPTVDTLKKWVEDKTEHDATQAAIGAIATTGRVTVVSPVDVTGTVLAPIIIGDDYLEANSTPTEKRHFEWTVPAIPGMDPTTAVMRFGIANDDFSCVSTGTITVSGANWILKSNLIRSKTEGFEPGDFEWAVELTGADGTEVTRVRSGKVVKLISKPL